MLTKQTSLLLYREQIQIVCAVILLHFCIVFMFVFFSQQNMPERLQAKIVVKTYTSAAMACKEVINIGCEAAAKEPVGVIVENISQSKKVGGESDKQTIVHNNISKNALKGNSAAKSLSKNPPKVISKQQNVNIQNTLSDDVKKKQQALLAAAQQSVADISKGSMNSARNTATKGGELNVAKASQLENLSVDKDRAGEQTGKSSHYYDSIIEKLQSTLKLPEVGDVSVKFTLNEHGEITTWNIIQSANEMNKRYVERQFPLLNLPKPIKELIINGSLTLTITLTNG